MENTFQRLLHVYTGHLLFRIFCSFLLECAQECAALAFFRFFFVPSHIYFQIDGGGRERDILQRVMRA